MGDEKLNVLFLYTDQFTHIRVINLDLASYKEFSKHNIYFAPGSSWAKKEPYLYVADSISDSKLYDEFETGQNIWDLSYFDAIVVHYGVRVTFDFYLSNFIATQLKNFDGIKVLYVQDEYEKTEIARKWMDLLQFDVVYTCVPNKYITKIYDPDRFSKTEFKNVLTGYVTSDLVDRDWLPLEERKLDIGYRGRHLSHQYGKLGFEKRYIGQKVKAYAEQAGLNIDIEWSDQERIYGEWLEFLGSCRATLATESGSNMFDFDGHLVEKAKQLEDLSFEDAYKDYFEPYDNVIQMNQVSPKIFESIAVGTLLICFEGEYSGVIKPNIHFLPLKKDFSNIQEIFKKISDDKFVTKMTRRAYKDIILSGNYHVKRRVEQFDDDLSARAPVGRKYDIISSPIALKRDGKIEPLLRSDINSFLINDKPILMDGHRKEFLGLYAEMDFVTQATKYQNLPQGLLYTDSVLISKYDQTGNIIPDNLHRQKLENAAGAKKSKVEKKKIPIDGALRIMPGNPVITQKSVVVKAGKGRKAVVQKYLGKKVADALVFLWKRAHFLFR